MWRHCVCVCDCVAQLRQRLRDVDGCLMCAQELTPADFKDEVAEFKSYAKTHRVKRAKVERVCMCGCVWMCDAKYLSVCARFDGRAVCVGRRG